MKVCGELEKQITLIFMRVAVMFLGQVIVNGESNQLENVGLEYPGR